MKAFFYGIVFSGVAFVAIAAALVSSGSIPVAASDGESSLTRWVLHSAYEQTLARQSQTVQVPGNLGEPGNIREGARSFKQMCAGCHTPPGSEGSVVARGMNPPPPELTHIAEERTPAQAFWVIKHGVRMTGMPAFGVSHSDEQLWSLVAFLERARSLDKAGYAELTRATETGAESHDGHDHRHFQQGDNAPSSETSSDKEAPAGEDAGEQDPAPARDSSQAGEEGDHPHHDHENHSH